MSNKIFTIAGDAKFKNFGKAFDNIRFTVVDDDANEDIYNVIKSKYCELQQFNHLKIKPSLIYEAFSVTFNTTFILNKFSYGNKKVVLSLPSHLRS